MAFAFQYHHGAMLLKYSGISFISGAVNHGFFSGERSLWTAAIGVVLFVLGAAMEHRLSDGPAQAPGGLMRTLALGALLSIGLGFFTGGLQHFPDSPARSSWVVPLGFVISVVALALSGSFTWMRSSAAYAVLATVLTTAASVAGWQWFERHPSAFAHSHGASDGHGHGATPAALTALTVDRSVEIRMDDQMRFTPSALKARAGETLRLVVHNDGKLPHELVLGTQAEIREHAELMKKGGHHDHAHAGGAAITVGPGQVGELVVRVAQAGVLQMACLVPGHYEAGMRGTLSVEAQGRSAPAPATPAAPSKAHDHSTHKH